MLEFLKMHNMGAVLLYRHQPVDAKTVLKLLKPRLTQSAAIKGRRRRDLEDIIRPHQIDSMVNGFGI